MLYQFNSSTLELSRCPHCNIASPLLSLRQQLATKRSDGTSLSWNVYACTRCGCLVVAGVLAGAAMFDDSAIFPKSEIVDDSIPKRAREYLRQAVESIHSASGAIMLCASSVDAMLKEKQFVEGSLYERIKAAQKGGLITTEMAKWAHEVRLDANDERHADEEVEMPTEQDARKCIDFTRAFAEYLFVLPAKIKRGLAKPGKVGEKK